MFEYVDIALNNFMNNSYFLIRYLGNIKGTYISIV